MSGVLPGHYIHRVGLVGFAGNLYLRAPIFLENAAFRYLPTTTMPSKGRFLMQWDFVGTGAEIAAKDIAQVLADARAVDQTVWFEYQLE